MLHIRIWNETVTLVITFFMEADILKQLERKHFFDSA